MKRMMIDDLPDSIKKIAEDLVSICVKNDGIYKSKRDEKVKKDMTWDDFIVSDKKSSNIEEWSWRDIVCWFFAACKKRFIPFIVRYERDVGIVKNIHVDLSSIGRTTKKDVKNLLEWAFENQEEVLKKEQAFTLQAIRNCVNLYAQQKPVEITDEIKKLGINLISDMMSEYSSHKTIGLLVRYGIPLTASFFKKMKPEMDFETVKNGICNRISSMVEGGDFNGVQEVARRSITFSPYPSDFPFQNWREEMFSSWEKSLCYDKQWWKKEDDIGGYFQEYENLRTEFNGGKI